MFKKYTNFNQNSTILGFYEIAKDEYKIYYEKKVVYGNKSSTFYSYLILKSVDDRFFIKEENDIVN
ncbi:hypothetical protein [Aliarcobacter butzleri]|uniref:hypothetical protein n=1 Tax=Aliarcobacter butzleri TaxID=28197 RepID=UPI002B25005D|nr:hypothetical protein [Aliarcobacter butzleri]